MMTERIQRAKDAYIDTKPSICYERAAIWTESHKQTEGEAYQIRRAKAFRAVCETLPVRIFDGELIVGAIGEARRSGILTPEFSWQWVDKEMDTFKTRKQDPYEIRDDQKEFVRNEIFPYWKGKSLEEAYLSRLSEETKHILIDTGIIDNDSKWRQAVGEVTPDYQDVLFPQGYRGIIQSAKDHLKKLSPSDPEALESRTFYESVILVSEGIVILANRYAEALEAMSKTTSDAVRKAELLESARICRTVPQNPPETFYEAIQFVWFVQLGGILSENPLALNLGRFDQFMYPFYEADLKAGRITPAFAQELVDSLWLKLSEWVWTISANTADYFAGYNQFQNLTVGGRKRDGSDGSNAVSFMCLEATKRVKTHQPGLSVRIHPLSSEDFVNAVLDLVKEGTGFPAIHSDVTGGQMLLRAGYDPEDARDWSNCGCVVPHFRKTGQWTAAVNVNFGAALEYALNEGKSRLDGIQYGLDAVPMASYTSYEAVKEAFKDQLGYLIEQSVVGTITAQQLHAEMVPRPFLSTCIDGCMTKGKDLSRGGAKYNIGPVLTGIGIGVVANALAVIKKLVFEEQMTDMATLCKALDANWEGYDKLREQAIAIPKYGNDIAYVDDIAVELSNFYFQETTKYRDIFGSTFNSAFMGISNYIPAGKIVGATPCGRKATMPLSEGVSPYVGSDTSTPLAAMKSAAKLNHDVHTGGTLLNLRIAKSVLDTPKHRAQFGAILQSFFAMGAFHVQFNVIKTEVLRAAQKDPSAYKDLLVRVAGYSTQFINLSTEVQEAIIARNEHQ
jgi:formate C-acetyltransferase